MQTLLKMKKLLLLINLITVCLLFSFCRNTKTQKKLGANSAGNTNAADTAKVSSKQFTIPGTSSGHGMHLDNAADTIKTNAVIHKAPEQGKIDSIKNAKQKNKFK